jgi:cell division protein FtsI/penicillin-binding protein 2
MAGYNDTLMQHRRLHWLVAILAVVAVLLLGRLFYLQVVRHGHYRLQAKDEQTQKYQLPARRGELFVRDGDARAPLALNQTLSVIECDPSKITDKPALAGKLAAALGGQPGDYLAKINAGSTAYAKLADRVSTADAAKVRDLKLKSVWIKAGSYRTYPEGTLAAQVVGFVNNEGIGQYGIEQYLNAALTGKPGQLSGKTDINGVPIATADNIVHQPVDGTSYVLTIDRNIQAMVETELASQVQKVKAKSGSVIIMDPATGAVRAMATYPSFDPNAYHKATDYQVFVNQTVANQFEPGSGMKAFTMAAGLDAGKVKPDSTYDDPGCEKIDGYNVCNAHGDAAGRAKTMTMVIRDSLNTGVMYVFRLLGGDPLKITLAGKKALYDYLTKRFGFGARTGIQQANEAAGSINKPTNAAGSNVNYANMTFGQGMSVTMLQMTSAMAAIANGGTVYQPTLIDTIIKPDGTEQAVAAKRLRGGVVSARAAADLTAMLEVVTKRGSGYRVYENPGNKGYRIAGKTGTAQIPNPTGKGYLEGKNIGSFVGFAPAGHPKFAMMVRINEPGVPGYAESTTVPVFSDITAWLFKYYGIPPEN